MMGGFRPIDDLPQREATDVKNQWSEITDELKAVGIIALTLHDTIEWIVMDAAIYRQMSSDAAKLKDCHADALEVLTAEFDQRLISLQGNEAHRRIDATMALKGDLTKVGNRPKGRS